MDKRKLERGPVLEAGDLLAHGYEVIEHLRRSSWARSTRYYTFSGGCVTYRFAFTDEPSPSLLFDAEQALAFQSRERIVEAVRENAGLDLCGAGVPCPGGNRS